MSFRRGGTNCARRRTYYEWLLIGCVLNDAAGCGNTKTEVLALPPLLSMTYPHPIPPFPAKPRFCTIRWDVHGDFSSFQ
jgi:hypothetical protein